MCARNCCCQNPNRAPISNGSRRNGEYADRTTTERSSQESRRSHTITYDAYSAGYDCYFPAGTVTVYSDDSNY